MKESVYVPQVVREIQGFFGDALQSYEKQPTARLYLYDQVRLLYDGLQQGLECLYSLVNNHHPDFLGTSVSQLKNRHWDMDECKLIIAKQYGFTDWKGVHVLDESLPLPFEQAVQALIYGEKETLQDLLDQHPGLVQARSCFGHQAALLHYAGSNGVEMWRQQVPSNLPELVWLLRDRGADLHATMQVYGGSFTTLELAKTSAHPYDAGIAKELEAALT
ncbi:MAG TPA: hypothetical protein DCE41_25450 [Cytophagales bacterium]|nr:hypothetical protein [Cytophagales bacterium]HAA20819.1 hypothetical protein [Cytophagales bacterium]HAP59107.1 hypothetical protein [Cytophagales bacterium]